jgi:ankyrin repeat protein
MKLLLKLGASVHHSNKTGSTPLHAASLNGYGEAMEILIEKGNFTLYHTLSSSHSFIHSFIHSFTFSTYSSPLLISNTFN